VEVNSHGDDVTHALPKVKYINPSGLKSLEPPLPVMVFFSQPFVGNREDRKMDFLKEVSGSSPLPAGGAAVAYTTCLAIGLIYKVVLFEIRRSGNKPDIERNLLTVKRELERLSKDTEKLVKEDPESYMEFARSRRSGDKAEKKQRFTDLLEVSMKVMEKSDSAFFWIDQLRRVAPGEMITHLQVASELLMGAANGTVHVVRADLQSIKVSRKRENYLKRLYELHEESKNRYTHVIENLKQR
jgi:formiminotetrahydrofolate cyclodeaminase